MNDEEVAAFCSITGADNDIANHYLSAAAGDLEVAISLYLDNQNTNSRNKESPIIAEDYVRAPIQPQRGRLIDNDETSINTSIASPLTTTTTNTTPIIEPFRDFQSEQQQEAGDERSRRLAEIFRPPTEIIFTGTFEAARTTARTLSKYLLITLHSPTTFPCQQMIRDVWRHPLIQSFIRESLIFLLLTQGTTEGQRYGQYYPVEGLPHWALIDPRTGRRVREWNGRVRGPEEVLMDLFDYLEENPINTNSESVKPSSEKRRVIEVESDDESEEDVEEDSNSEEESIEVLPEEPLASDPNSIQIQFRLPNGTRCRRRFLQSDPIKLLFTFIKSLRDPSIPTLFEFVHGGGRLSREEHFDDLISQHDLKNAALTIVIKE